MPSLAQLIILNWRTVSIRLLIKIQLAFLLFCAANIAHADFLNWYASLTRLQGNDQCVAGERDCNPCANNVQNQFNQLLRTDDYYAEPDRSTRSWWLSSDRRYPPSNRTPEAVFNIGDEFPRLDILTTESLNPWSDEFMAYHVQGFVRTYSKHYNYVGSHSDSHHGSIFLINHPSERNQLSKIYSTDTNHPSGISVIGQYIVYADGKNKLQLLDLDAVPNEPTKYELPRSDPKQKGLSHAGGGVAIVRLKMGGHLLLVTDGDGGGESNESRLFYLGGNLEKPSSKIYLGQLQTIHSEHRRSQAYVKSENLDLITECGTGTIYSIHISGANSTAPNVGQGWWRLSELEWGAAGPQLRYLNHKSMDQDLKDCHLRSAGSVYVTSNHDLHFYCHARNADVRESDFNVIK